MSHMFEQPYRFMPLYQIAKVSMLDVADALCARPPLETDEITFTKDGKSPRRPLYWAAAAADPSLPRTLTPFVEGALTSEISSILT